jgi:Rrf2 family nitric oxide-sensitive transcriptional repressor
MFLTLGGCGRYSLNASDMQGLPEDGNQGPGVLRPRITAAGSVSIRLASAAKNNIKSTLFRQENRLRLTFYTDYSLRMLIYLAVKGDGLSTIEEIADAYGISRNHLMKVAHKLGREGFIETVRGRGGGLRLGRPPSKIKIGEVVRATEDDFRMVECFDLATNTCRILGACNLKGILAEALDAWAAVLDRYTLANLVQEPKSIAQMLDMPSDAIVAPPRKKASQAKVLP